MTASPNADYAGTSTVDRWDAEEAACLDPDQELETIELGDRVAWDFTMMLAATAYRLEDREWAVKIMLLGQVADRYRRDTGRGNVTGLVPAEWVPQNGRSGA